MQSKRFENWLHLWSIFGTRFGRRLGQKMDHKMAPKLVNKYVTIGSIFGTHFWAPNQTKRRAGLTVQICQSYLESFCF